MLLKGCSLVNGYVENELSRIKNGSFTDTWIRPSLDPNVWKN